MIVDASVAFKWLYSEADSQAATELLARDDLAAPDLIDVEIGQALTKKVRQRALDRSSAEQLWRLWPALPLARRPSASLRDDAFALSLRLNAAFPDCLYLALALALNDQMITADARFVGAAESVPGLRRHVVNLADVRMA